MKQQTTNIDFDRKHDDEKKKNFFINLYSIFPKQGNSFCCIPIPIINYLEFQK